MKLNSSTRCKSLILYISRRVNNDRCIKLVYDSKYPLNIECEIKFWINYVVAGTLYITHTYMLLSACQFELLEFSIIIPLTSKIVIDSFQRTRWHCAVFLACVCLWGDINFLTPTPVVGVWKINFTNLNNFPDVFGIGCGQHEGGVDVENLWLVLWRLRALLLFGEFRVFAKNLHFSNWKMSLRPGNL